MIVYVCVHWVCVCLDTERGGKNRKQESEKRMVDSCYPDLMILTSITLGRKNVERECVRDILYFHSDYFLSHQSVQSLQQKHGVETTDREARHLLSCVYV